jgi:hypothetical protein
MKEQSKYSDVPLKKGMINESKLAKIRYKYIK